MTATTSRQCAATTKRGKQCKAYALADSDYCYHHDPAHAGERARARSKGGKARHGRKVGTTGDAEPVGLESVADVLPILAGEMNALLTLEKSVSRARAVGYLCGVLVKVFEVSELQARVEALEAVLKARDK